MLAFVNFDAASSQVLERLLADGRLPALGALRRDGVRVPLESLGSRFPAATYPTIYTGVELGRHGLYYPFQWLPWEQRVVPAERLPAPPSLWERVRDAGGRALVLDPYEARVPRGLNGTFVSGAQFRNQVVLPAASVPRTRTLRRRSPNVDEVFGARSRSRLRSLRRNLLGAADRLAELSCRLLARERFDLAWIGIATVHLAGHQFWDDQETLAEVYAAADRALGRIVQALPEEADLVVFSGQGMDENVSRIHLLPGMLAAVLRGGERAVPGRALWRARGVVPTSVRAAAARALPRKAALELTTRLETRGVDWSEVRAFTVPSDSTGYVRLNVRGREREGCVAPGEVGALCDEIVAGLATFRDPDGAPSVAAVERVPASGPRHGLFPDLVVVWNRRPGAAGLSAVSSEAFGLVHGPSGGSGRTGDHVADAWAILVPGCAQVVAREGPARLIDLAATACPALRGTPLLAR